MPLLKLKTAHAIEITHKQQQQQNTATFIGTHIQWVCSEHFFLSLALLSCSLVRNSTSNHSTLATKHVFSSEADRIRFSMCVCVCVSVLLNITQQFYGSAIFIIIMIIPTRKRRQVLETALVPTLSLIVMTMLNIHLHAEYFCCFLCVCVLIAIHKQLFSE